MRLDVLPAVADELALGAPVGLPVGEGVLGQVVLADEAAAADGALEVARAVGGLVLAEGAGRGGGGGGGSKK